MRSGDFAAWNDNLSCYQKSTCRNLICESVTKVKSTVLEGYLFLSIDGTNQQATGHQTGGDCLEVQLTGSLRMDLEGFWWPPTY